MSIGKEARLVDTLRHLIALDWNAISAYQAAVDRLESPRFRRALEEFMTDHFRHTQQLIPFVEELGGVAPDHADAMSLLTKGRVLFGHLMGDHGVLMAMHSNEDDTNNAYENACARPDVTPQLLQVLERALIDERRHREWLERVLGQPQRVLPISSHYMYAV